MVKIFRAAPLANPRIGSKSPPASLSNSLSAPTNTYAHEKPALRQQFGVVQAACARASSCYRPNVYAIYVQNSPKAEINTPLLYKNSQFLTKTRFSI